MFRVPCRGDEKNRGLTGNSREIRKNNGLHYASVASIDDIEMQGSGTNNNFGLDLAVIGNGRTAALLEPASRLVWEPGSLSFEPENGS